MSEAPGHGGTGSGGAPSSGSAAEAAGGDEGTPAGPTGARGAPPEAGGGGGRKAKRRGAGRRGAGGGSTPSDGGAKPGTERRRGGDGNASENQRGNAARRPKPAGKRHQGRILALQLLYELDVAGHGVDEVLTRTFVEESPPAGVRGHVERLVRGVREHQTEIDPYIAAAAPAYPVSQLPTIDRNVLRIAIFELLREPDVPPKAAINEAVELAKSYGGDNSARFVNGVLGTVFERVPGRRAGHGGAAANETPDAESAPVPPAGEGAEAAG